MSFSGKLGVALDLSALSQALADRGRLEKRRSRLPALSVALLVIAAPLFRDLSLVDLVLLLGLSLPVRGAYAVTASAITQARQRLGSDALRLFSQRQQQAHLAALPPQARWRGLLCLALDGSCLKTLDTPENRSFFGSHAGRFGLGAHPLVRLLVLFEVSSRAVVDLAMLPFRATSELGMVAFLLDSLPVQALLLLDRGFFSASLLLDLTRRGAFWLLPLRSTASYRVVRTLGPNEWLVEFEVSDRARRRNPSLPTTFQARVLRVVQRGWRPRFLATSLLDPKAYPAAEVAARYGWRWQAELGLGDQKTRLLAQKPLRSQRPEWVEQEVWGLVIAYNALKAVGERYAETLALAPSELCFVALLHRVRFQLVVASVQTPQRQAWLEESTEGLVKAKPRKGRRCRREVKSRKSKFPVKKPGKRAPTEMAPLAFPWFDEGERRWAA